MGNCCCPRSEEQQTLTTSSGRRNQAFQGEGHRLGTANEEAQYASPIYNNNNNEEPPSPTLDPNMTDEERAKIRADRAAAAEARLKKQGGGGKGKSNAKTKKTDGDAPLRGPNSEPLMRWTA